MAQARASEIQPVRADLVDDYDPSRFVESLQQVIRCATVVNDDGTYDETTFDEMAKVLVQRFPLVHQHLEREIFNRHGVLLTWRGTKDDLDPIVLMAHQDVVPVEAGTESDWTVPPFSGAVADGRIYGRGALDCKGSLIAILEAVEYMLERDVQIERTVLVVLGHDEEVGGHKGAKVIARELEERGVRPWFVVDEGGSVVVGIITAVDSPVALVGIAEKGYMDVTLTAEGEGGHSSIPPRDTPLVQIADAVAKLDRSPMKPRIGTMAPMLRALSGSMSGVAGRLAGRPAMAAPILTRVFARDNLMNALQRTTMVPTVMSGGEKINVIPQLASAHVNVRIIPGDTIASVTSHIRSVVGPDVHIEVDQDVSWEPSALSSTESDGWRVVTGVIGSIFPNAIISPWVVVGAADARYFEEFSAGVYRFAPFEVDSEAIAGVHATNEFVNVKDAQRAVSFFVRLISAAATTAD